MIYKTCLMELFDSLVIVGHLQLWLEMGNDPEFPLHWEILTWDGRVVAWWHEQESSWFLTQEVDIVNTNSNGTTCSRGVQLFKEDCFQHSTVVNI